MEQLSTAGLRANLEYAEAQTRHALAEAQRGYEAQTAIIRERMSRAAVDEVLKVK